MDNVDKTKNTENTQTQGATLNKITKILAIALAFVVTFTAGYFSKYIFDNKKVTLVSEVVKIIENQGYIVDFKGVPKDVSEEEYADALVKTFLDDYSAYYTKEEYEDITNQRNGDMSGFGISMVNSTSASPTIISVEINSPAEIAGLKAGDIVVSVEKDGKTTAVDNGAELAQMLTGEVGTQVTLRIKRDGEVLDTQFTIVKSIYKKCYVEYFDNEQWMNFRTNEKGKQVKNGGLHNTLDKTLADTYSQMDNETALIKLSKFEGDAAEQFQTAIEYMEERGRTKLILDLRDNGGGYMDVLTKLAGSLIINNNKKTLIAYSKGKSSEQSFYMDKTHNNDFIDYIVVLANGNTASASECLIGAMLHYGENFSIDNLVVEGGRTYGKGIMQTTYILSNGGALKLTTARIYQPDKTTCIHGTGIVPEPQNQTQNSSATITKALDILYAL